MRIVEKFLHHLPKPALDTLIALRNAYPNTPLQYLPLPVQAEVKQILTSAMASAQSNTPARPQVDLPVGRQVMSPNITTNGTPRSAPARNVLDLHTVLGTDEKTGLDVTITQRAKQQGTYIIGENGTGKTNILKTMAVSDIQNGLGVCVIEPHGDLTGEILGAVPRHRQNDIIYLDIEDWENPFGLNIYDVPQPRNIRTEAAVASFVSHIFEVLWSAGFETPRLMQNLRAVTRTLIANPGAHFGDIPLLYSSEEVRARMLANVTNPHVLAFWAEYEAMNFRDRRAFTESTLNKVTAFLDEPMIQHILAQSRTTIDFRYIMDNAKILLIKLSPQFEEASRLIGTVIIGKLLMTAFSRADTLQDERIQFNLYCDELHRFQSSDCATLISEVRKFRISTILSHQTLPQLTEQVRASALGAGNIIVFRASGDDSRVLSKSFDTTPARIVNGEEVVRAPVTDIITHLVRRGHADSRVAKFGQAYLANLERFISKPPGQHEPRYSAYYNCFDGQISLPEKHVVLAREWLNDTLYQAMLEKRSDLHIQTLSLYILAVAQGDGREYILSNWVTKSFDEFKAFEPGAEKFGNPSFTTPETSQAYLSQITKGWKKKRVWMAEEMVSMIKEIRYCMEVLSREPPLMVDTGRVQPRYTMQTHADREAEISKEITLQQNFTARVKLVNTGEYVIRTKPAPEGLTSNALAERIETVKRHMRALGYTRHYTEVIDDLRKRQEELLGYEDTPDEDADDYGDDPNEPPRGSFTLD